MNLNLNSRAWLMATMLDNPAMDDTEVVMGVGTESVGAAR